MNSGAAIHQESSGDRQNPNAREGDAQSSVVTTNQVQEERHYCGIDVHKHVLVAHIVDQDGTSVAWGKFHHTPQGLEELKHWLVSLDVSEVAFESTNVYWIGLYDILAPCMSRVIMANARVIKHIPGRKTDMRDAQWIAYLLAKDMIPASYVAPRWLRELRALTRTRQNLVKTRTGIVNHLHAVLDEHHVDVISVFSSWHSQSCLHVLRHLAEGTTSWEDVLTTAPCKRVRTTLVKHERHLQPWFHRALPVSVRTRLKVLLIQLDALKASFAEVEHAIEEAVQGSRTPACFRDAVTLAETIPGWGRITAVTVVAEIGDFRRFRSADQLVAWVGLDPFVYQSAGKLYRGSITKRGNKHVRAALYSCVVPALNAQSKSGRFAKLYRRLRCQRKKPVQVAKVAVMAKMLRVLFAMVRDGVPYHD